MALQTTLALDNVMAQVPHATSVEQNSQSTHIESMHLNAFEKKTSMPPWKKFHLPFYHVLLWSENPKSSLTLA
jgi:hypothetical protein